MKLDRRELLAVIAGGTAAAACGKEAVEPPPSRPPGFLTEPQREALEKVADYVLPPDDLGPGGAALGIVAYTEGLLTAFDVDPPRIHAGGPYSGRMPFTENGVPTQARPENGFTTFVPLDRTREAAWRAYLYGAAGTPGLRDRVKAGLDDVNAKAGGSLAQKSSAEIGMLWGTIPADFRDTLLDLILECAFSAPEYGGNAGLAGWRLAHVEGDVQPRGYSFFDERKGQYKELVVTPVSEKDPGPEVDPIDEVTWSLIDGLVMGVGGRRFD